MVVPDKVKVVGNYSPSNHNASRIVDSQGLAPTVMENHGTQTAVVINDPKVIGGIGEKKSNGGTQYYYQDRIYEGDVANTLASVNPYYKNDLRIRKLTARECWRLMAFSDEDFDKASKVNSNAQLYKQAGNSIVVNVLEAIFKEML